MRRSVLVTGAACAAVALFASNAQAAPTLTAQWRLDMPTGGIAYDRWAPFNNGRIVGKVTPGVAGVYGYAYRFFGGFVRVPDSPTLDPGAKPFAWTVHIKAPANLSVGDYNISQKGHHTSPGGHFKMELGGSLQRGVGVPRCAFVDAGGNGAVVKATTDVADGRWHRVTCTKTSTAVSIYVDGVVRGNTNVRLGSISNSSPLVFGAKDDGTAHFTGDLDHITMTIG